MLGHAGFFTGLPKTALDGMIEVVKGVEPETGYGAILQLSEAEAQMRELRIRRTKTVCTYCGVGCSFDVWTKDRHILKVAPLEGPTNGISTCVKGKFAWDYVNSPDRLTKPLIRENGKFREASWDEALNAPLNSFPTRILILPKSFSGCLPLKVSRSLPLRTFLRSRVGPERMCG